MLGVAMLSACGGGDGGGNTTPTQPGGGTTSVLTSITITAATSTVTDTGTIQLTAQPRDQFGSAMSANITWSSAAPAVAAVDASGVVTGIVAGSAVMTASSGSVSANTTVTVTGNSAFGSQAVVQMPSINAFTPPTTNIAVNGTVSFQFPNEAHNVIFTSGTGRPADIPVMQNTPVTRQFTTKGAFPYVCTLHSAMQGKVVVH